MNDRNSWMGLCLLVFLGWAIWIIAISCIPIGNKGVEVSPDKSQKQQMQNRQGTRIKGDDNTVWNIAVQSQSAAPWIIAGFSIVGWVVRARRDRTNEAALMRTMSGIEACGPECEGKRFCKLHAMDKVERILNAKTRKLNGQKVKTGEHK